MAAECEQIRERMLELLYGELSADARAEVAAHLAGCDACRAELAALESTRALAHRALSADSPPPRARQAILQAAAAAAATTARRSPAPAKPSLWAWLRRTRWTLPTFATVGAVAVFLLASRIFLEPEKTYERGKQGLVPAQAAPAAGSPVPTSAPEPMPREEKPAARERGEPAAQPAAKPAGHAKHAARAREPAPEAAAPAPSFAPPPPPAKDEAMQDQGTQDREAREEPPTFRAMESNKKSRREDTGPAPPPPAPPPRAAAPAPAAAAAPVAAAPAPAAPRAAARPAAKSEASAAEGLAAPAGSGAAVERESPAARADRLFAQQRWTEAAAAYDQLLRDDPRNASAARWRQRLAACKAALEQER